MSPLRFTPPQLPSLTEHPPEGAEWIHEVKHDGYRTMLLVERGTVHAYTRNGHDWSDRYPGIIAAARKLPCRRQSLMAKSLCRMLSVCLTSRHYRQRF